MIKNYLHLFKTAYSDFLKMLWLGVMKTVFFIILMKKFWNVVNTLTQSCIHTVYTYMDRYKYII